MQKSTAFYLIGLTAMFGCGQTDAPPAQRTGSGGVTLGGAITINLKEMPTSVDPRTVVAPNAAHLAGHVHLGLMRFDAASLVPLPAIAESVEVSDSGNTYLFTLRSDVHFQDDLCFEKGKGRAITSADVVYSFERLCAPDSAATAFATTFRNRVKGADEFRAGKTTTIAGISAIDDQTVQIVLTRPDQAFLHVLASPATAIVAREVVQRYADGGKVGAGPFSLEITDQGAQLRRNATYYAKDAFNNPLPYLDTVHIITLADKRAELEALFNGQLDLITDLGTAPVKDLLENHVVDFTGAEPKYVMLRNDDAADAEVYTVYRSGIKGFKENFMRYRDYSVVQRLR